MAFTPWMSLVGGALIGLSASALLVMNGRVAGISGIVGGVLVPRRGDVAWRASFLLGLLAGGAGLLWLCPWAFTPPRTPLPAGMTVAAGILVGVGTAMAGGCTSGHGVCGVSRASVRSIAAVLTFMAAAMVATFVVRHALPRLG
jgi:uncharacterized membrane protein YedE/YeeE